MSSFLPKFLSFQAMALTHRYGSFDQDLICIGADPVNDNVTERFILRRSDPFMPAVRFKLGQKITEPRSALGSMVSIRSFACSFVIGVRRNSSIISRPAFWYDRIIFR